MDILKDRNEIDSKHKWNLDDYYTSDAEYFSDCDKAKKALDKLEKYKGKITNNGKNLYKFLVEKDKVENWIEQIYVYGYYYRYHPDTTDNDGQTAKSKAEELYNYYLKKTSFVENELLSADLKELVKDYSKNELYEYYLNKLLRNKEHTLSDAEEMILAKMSNAMGVGRDIYECIMYSDVDFGEIKDEEGETIQVTSANYSQLMRSKNRDLRKRAFESKHNYYKNFKNTISATYKATVKEALFVSDVRKFSSALEMNLFNNELSDKVYSNLLNSIKGNTDILKKFLDIKRRLLNLDELHMYDLAVTPELEVNDKIEYNDAIKFILSAISVISDDYKNKVIEYLDKNMIDIFPNKGKYTGGYQVGTYKKMPRILYNYTNTFSNLYGVAHEIGHAMHTYYANDNQPYIYSNYNIVAAETASLTNEVILTDYLLKSAKTKDEKVFYLLKHLEQIDNYYFSVILNAEHEKAFYENEIKEMPLSLDNMSQVYYDLYNEYYGGNKVITDDLKRYGWMHYGHYHNPYYFYKYALGMSAALVIGNNINNNKEGFTDKYISFLSNGASKSTLELFKELGVDLESKETFNSVIKYFREKVELLEELIKE
jgi:Oligoendopeptidase F